MTATTAKKRRPRFPPSCCSIQTALLLIAVGLLVTVNIQQSLMLEMLTNAIDFEAYYGLFHRSPPPQAPPPQETPLLVDDGGAPVQQQQQQQPNPADTVQRRVLDVHDASTIRSWGCNVTATPFVFVHIGKAGGGNVRRRLAGAAVDVARHPLDWKRGKLDEHYYPVRVLVRNNDNSGVVHHGNRNDDGDDDDKNNAATEATPTTTTTTTIHRAKFCSSGRHRHVPVVEKSFEHYSQRCTAVTPIGHVLACPEIFSAKCPRPHGPNNPGSAHLVYAGHNLLGTELHWLPIPYLRDWWNEHWGSTAAATASSSSIDTKEEANGEEEDEEEDRNDDDAEIEEDEFLQRLVTLDGVLPWCQDLPRPLRLTEGVVEYGEHWDCAQEHLEPAADALAESTLRQHFPGLATDEQWGRAFGQLYTSLPVTRVTVIREPISWLLSKWAWHKLGIRQNLPCDDIAAATALESYTDLHDECRPGWATLMSLHYILYLCGEDCHARLEAGKATLEQIEAQAAYNLRNSFAVVGLLKEQDAFFEMIDARVDYMDMHRNTDLYGDGDHMSKKDERCEEVFQDEQFQRDLVAASPELQALVRLYEIGVQVNQFQMQELEQCSGRTLAVEHSTHPQERKRDFLGSVGGDNNNMRNRVPRLDVVGIQQRLNKGRRRRVKGAPRGPR